MYSSDKIPTPINKSLRAWRRRKESIDNRNKIAKPLSTTTCGRVLHRNGRGQQNANTPGSSSGYVLLLSERLGDTRRREHQIPSKPSLSPCTHLQLPQERRVITRDNLVPSSHHAPANPRPCGCRSISICWASRGTAGFRRGSGDSDESGDATTFRDAGAVRRPHRSAIIVRITAWAADSVGTR